MSIEYAASIVVGYVVSIEDLFEPFMKEAPEKFHLEDRFHSKTGKKLEPEKVVDREAGWIVVLPGDEEEYSGPTVDDMEDRENGWQWTPDDNLMEAVGGLLNACVSLHGGEEFGHEFVVAIEPFDAPGQFISPSELASLEPDIVRIGQTMKEYGIDAKEGGVHVVMDIF